MNGVITYKEGFVIRCYYAWNCSLEFLESVGDHVYNLIINNVQHQVCSATECDLCPIYTAQNRFLRLVFRSVIQYDPIPCKPQLYWTVVLVCGRERKPLSLLAVQRCDGYVLLYHPVSNHHPRILF